MTGSLAGFWHWQVESYWKKHVCGCGFLWAGDPADGPAAAEHGSSVSAADVRSPAAAHLTSDRSPAAAACPCVTEPDHHTTGLAVTPQHLLSCFTVSVFVKLIQFNLYRTTIDIASTPFTEPTACM